MHSTPVRRREERRAGGRVLLWLCVVLFATAVGLVVLSFSQGSSADATGARDMRGELVEADDAASALAAQAEADIGEVFSVPSVGLRVPLGALDEVQGVISPPGYTSAYLVRNLGVGLEDAETGSVFVVMHSIRGGGLGPGNYLFNLEEQTSKVAIGDEIHVGSRVYSVETVENIPKGEISRREDVWGGVPGSLVVITCLQRPGGGPSVDNFVVTAALVP